MFFSSCFSISSTRGRFGGVAPRTLPPEGRRNEPACSNLTPNGATLGRFVDPVQRGYKSSQCGRRWLTKRQRHRRYLEHQCRDSSFANQIWIPTGPSQYRFELGITLKEITGPQDSEWGIERLERCFNSPLGKDQRSTRQLLRTQRH